MNHLLKKCAAIALAVVMIVGTMPLHAFYDAASPAQGIPSGATVIDESNPQWEWVQIYAAGAFDYQRDYVKRDLRNDPNLWSRLANPASAFGPSNPTNGTQYGDGLFTGVGLFVDGISYRFGHGVGDYRRIYRQPNRDLPDFTITEITWDIRWHFRGARLYLLNVEFADGTSAERYYVGDIFNRVYSERDDNNTVGGYMSDGFSVDSEVVGGIFRISIWFADNIVSAEAVRLEDFTGEIHNWSTERNGDPVANTGPNPRRTFSRYCSGFCVDAMSAWYRRPVGNDGPSIRVLTEFPDGEVDIPFVDIQYVATPTPGAVITEVFYTNNGAVTYIYISEASRYASTRGTFGEARVFITPQPNNQFVFYVRDSAGGEATYTVANTPTVNMGMFDTAPPQDLRYAERITEFEFVQTDRILIRAEEGVTPAQMAEFANYLGGSIIRQVPLTRLYTIGFPFNRTYAELQEFREFLHAEYPHIVWNTHISTLPDPDNTLFSVDGIVTGPGIPAGTLFTTSPPALPAVEVQAPHSFRTTCDICRGRGPTCDPFWGSPWEQPGNFYQYPLDWGFRATNLPAAWQYFDNNQRTIRIGVMDTWFNPTLYNVHPNFERPRYWPAPHPSLSMAYANLRNLPNRPMFNTTAQNHGNMVLALIASEHNTCRGIAGGVDLPRNAVFAHATPSIAESKRDALFWLIVQGSQVVNVSMNAQGMHNAQIINEELAFLLSVGYDALVVQSAGNQGKIATSDNRIFSYRGIMDNVITVTASTRDGHVWEHANWGQAVREGLVPINVAAPGHGIYTLTESGYNITSGTSFAAPFVSSVAVLAWKNNPALDARAIRNVVIQATQTMGAEIIDDREYWRDNFLQVDAFATVGLATVWDPVHMYSAVVGYVGQYVDPLEVRYEPLGDPVPNASIALFEFGTFNVAGSVTTCERGFFRIGNVSPGMYEVRASADGFVSHSQSVEVQSVGVTTVVAMLNLLQEGSGNVGGRFFRRSANASSLHEPLAPLFSPLTDPTLEPILEAVTLTFRPARDVDGRQLAYGQSEIVKTYTTDKGYFDITLPAGEYFVTATAEGFQSAMRTVTSNGGRSISGQDIFLQPHDFDKVITTVDQLLYVTTAIQNNSTINGIPAASARYRLAADLDLSNVDTFFGLGTFDNPFAGTFYGGGHSIRLNINHDLEPCCCDLYDFDTFAEAAILAMDEAYYITPAPMWFYDGGTTGFVGLFRFTDGATISHITVEGSVQGRVDVGGIVGNAINTTLSNVENRALITGWVWDDQISPGIGGIAGSIENSTISNSTNRANVSSRWGQGVGGIAGNASQSQIIGSTSIGDISGNMSVGGLVGWAVESDISASTVLGNISGWRDIGGIVGTAFWRGTTITNVEVLPGSTITGRGGWVGGAGGIVGRMQASSVTYSRMHGNVTAIPQPDWFLPAGGIAGAAENSTITDNEIWGIVYGEVMDNIVGWATNTYIARNTVHQP